MSQDKPVIDFMGKRKLAMLLSAVLLVVSIASLATKQLNLGLDFTGGTLVEVNYSEPQPLSAIRETLRENNYSGAVVTHFGSDTDVLVRLPQAETAEDKANQGEQVVATLQQDFAGDITLRRVEFVGPQVGEELREQGGLAMLLALAVVMLYVAFRFQYKFSLGAVAALIHDVIIILGVFSVFNWEFDLTVLAALLAIIGYSLNDTIVVCDRIRENFRKIRRSDVVDVINLSLTETFGRTVVTSLTTLLVLFALFIFGGESIAGFAEALIVGVIVGTYSSIYVSANFLLVLNVSNEDLMVPVKEGVELDELP